MMRNMPLLLLSVTISLPGMRNKDTQSPAIPYVPSAIQLVILDQQIQAHREAEEDKDAKRLAAQTTAIPIKNSGADDSARILTISKSPVGMSELVAISEQNFEATKIKARALIEQAITAINAKKPNNPVSLGSTEISDYLKILMKNMEEHEALDNATNQKADAQSETCDFSSLLYAQLLNDMA